MSCEVFAKVRKDLMPLERIFTTLTRESVDVVDVSAKPSLDKSHYFLRLKIESDLATAERIFANSEALSGVRIS